MGEALSVPEGPEGQAQELGAAGSTQESVLLSQLIQLLHQRERHSLLLSDLGALLPGVLRQRVKDQGGLRSWLQRYPSLFAVVGQPGKESVTLCLGAAVPVMQGTAELPAPVEPAVDSEVSPTNGALAETDEIGAEEDIDTLSAIQLRGLPYRATMEDIVSFLGEHSSDLAESNAVTLVQNRDGRPSGFARVQFTSPESARNCVAALHLRSLDDRYIEVFLYNERPSKGRQRRGGHEDGTLAPGEATRVPLAVDASGVTRDQVVRECRAQMADVKQRRLLLSMLGVGLSPGARGYLKQMDQGLKHFLVQFPNEFSVDGGKGCEYVTYSPTQLSLSQAIDGFDADSTSARAVGSRASGTDEPGRLTASPKSMPAHLSASPAAGGLPSSASRVCNTPSDWGTPSVQQWQGPAQPWVPPWPQGGPGAPGTDPSMWGGMPAWGTMQMPPSQQFGWPAGGWPAYPPWGGSPPMEGVPPTSAADMAAAAAAGLGTAPGGLPSAAPQQPATAPSANAPNPAPAPAPAGPPVAAVRLRGLPFTSAEQDVLAFFAQHDIVDRIADGPHVVNILTRSNGRPSGQAIIQMREAADAELAQMVLHGQWMGSRYIEVFLLTAEENEANGTGAGPASSPTKAGHEQISLSTGLPLPSAPVPMMPSSASQPPAVPSTAPAQDMSGQFQGMAPGIPPWQLDMWSNAMAAGTLGGPPPLGAVDFGAGGSAPGGPDGSSWEALFEFLGPESAAAMTGGMPPTPLDFSAMGMAQGGYGLPAPAQFPGMQGAHGADGIPPANGTSAAAAV